MDLTRVNARELRKESTLAKSHTCSSYMFLSKLVSKTCSGKSRQGEHGLFLPPESEMVATSVLCTSSPQAIHAVIITFVLAKKIV